MSKKRNAFNYALLANASLSVSGARLPASLRSVRQSAYGKHIDEQASDFHVPAACFHILFTGSSTVSWKNCGDRIVRASRVENFARGALGRGLSILNANESKSHILREGLSFFREERDRSPAVYGFNYLKHALLHSSRLHGIAARAHARARR